MIISIRLAGTKEQDRIQGLINLFTPLCLKRVALWNPAKFESSPERVRCGLGGRRCLAFAESRGLKEEQSEQTTLLTRPRATAPAVSLRSAELNEVMLGVNMKQNRILNFFT